MNILRTFIGFFMLISPVWAQVVPNASVTTVAVNRWDRVLRFEPGDTSQTANLGVPPTVQGPEVVQIRLTSPALQAELVLPSGAVINTTNAAAAGYTFDVLDLGPANLTQFGALFFQAGRTVFVEFPSSRPGGNYQIRVSRAAAGEAAMAQLSYSAAGPLQAAAFTFASHVRSGEQMNIGAALANGSQAVSNATVTADVVARRDLAATVPSLQLLSDTTTAAGDRRLRYQPSIAVSSSALPASGVAATAEAARGANFKIAEGSLFLGTITTSAALPSPQTILIETDGQLPNLSQLRWSFVSHSEVASGLPLAETGPSAGSATDGVYSAGYVPPSPGRYEVRIRMTASIDGVTLERTASTSFDVVATSALLASVQSRLQDDNGNGRPDRMIVSFAADVSLSGSYSIQFSLESPNGGWAGGWADAVLGAGRQTIEVSVPAESMIEGGLDGVLAIRSVILQRDADSGSEPADSRADMGATVAVNGSLLDRGPVYFTGAPTVTGINPNAAGTFAALRVQVGLVAEAPDCVWEAELTDAAGNTIARSSGGQSEPGPLTSVAFDFAGYEILGAQRNAPWQVRNAHVSCNGASALQRVLAVISNFSPGQFTFVPKDFLVQLRANSIAVAPGGGKTTSMEISTTGGLSGEMRFAVAGEPPGLSVSIPGPLPVPNEHVFQVRAQPGVAPGSYPLTIHSTVGALQKATPFIVHVAAFPPTVTIAPSQPVVALGQSIQFSATVSGTADQRVRWKIIPALGSISPAGLYQAPAAATPGERIGVYAYSLYDESAYEAIALTLTAPLQVTVTPSAISVYPGQQVEFAAEVRNSNNAAVAWRLEPAAGTLESTGADSVRYTAPVPGSPQTVRLVATSVQDASQTGFATLTLRPAFTLSLSAPANQLNPAESAPITVSSPDGGPLAVDWSVSPSVGVVSAAGVYTAPGLVNEARDVTVTATSKDDPRVSASFAIRVNAGVASVLPTPWTYRYLGGAALFGPAVNYAATTFSLGAAGCCYDSQRDQLLFVSQPVAGDLSITARVNNFQPAASLPGEAGLSLRSLDSDGSPHVAAGVARDGALLQLVAQFRGTADTTPERVEEWNQTASWFKVIRAGTSVDAYRSGDGMNWLPLGVPATLAGPCWPGFMSRTPPQASTPWRLALPPSFC